MKITSSLIESSPSFINAVKDRELDLRGCKIPYIENLGATQDQFDTIDLSDNEITKLENFPLLRRLHTLILNNNRITKIADNVGATLVSLQWLVLTNNRFAKLSDLDPLANCKKLTHLILLSNPVTELPNYRLYVIYLIPSLKVLDFAKVRARERREAIAKFDKNQPASNTFVPGEIVINNNNANTK